MNELNELHEYLLLGYRDCEKRITVLEQRRRVTPISFGNRSLPETNGERLEAIQALLRLRIERLESLHGINF
jgi:hypothetical protein